MTKTTNASTTAPHSETPFQELLRDMGVVETHGLEVLRLVRMVANAYDAILAERMRATQLSAPRWRLLLRLLLEERRGNTAVSPTQLSKTQNVSKNTISAHLRSLEEMGLIAREVDPEDLRQFHIRLTRAGRELIEASTPAYMTFLNTLTGGLSREEVEVLQGLLQRLYLSLQKHAPAQGAGPDHP